jgi:thioester reductase-like protein
VHFLDRFDPDRFFEAVQQQRIQRTSLVPAMCETLLAAPNSGCYDLSSLRRVIVGGGVVSPSLVERFARAFGIALTIQYGLSGIGFVSRSSYSSPGGSSGRLSPGVQAKTVDHDGRTLEPGRTGALLLRRRAGASGELWRRDLPPISAADPSGWFRTGDLARFDADGELYITGRTDDLIIQGGYNIQGQELTEIISGLPAVRECAIVGVPSEHLGAEAVACVALRPGTRLTSKDVIAHCREHLEPRGVPTAVLFVEALPRNESGKVRNHDLRATVATARAAVRETDLIRRLCTAPPEGRAPMLREAMADLLKGVLRSTGASQAGPDTTFADMGLDSLGAMEFAEAVSAATGRQVPTTMVYSHPTIEAMCDGLLNLLALPAGRGLAAATPRTVDEGAADIHLDEILSDLAATAPARPAAGFPKRPEVVLLTGANGFLGRFLVTELLSRFPASNGRLYCLVRASNDASAFERLRMAYGSDPSLRGHFDRIAAGGRLTVLAGDVTKPRFGLPEAVHARLCEEVESVVHNAAVVNHLVGYGELVAPNVLGTVEVARFAAAHRIKAIEYLSSAAALRSLDRLEGYAFSKRMSEKVLRELSERLGLPVRVYRPSRILAHSRYLGQINAADAFTRLLQGLVLTSIAPRSFYEDEGSANGACYDALPVDAVARSIASLATAPIHRVGYVEYHVANPHRDVSLDLIVDWVRSAGYPVQPIDDYRVWFRTFKERLGLLERSVRQYSVLPLLHMWEHPRSGGRIRPDTASFERHLAQASRLEGAASFAGLPPLSEGFIHKSLSDMCALGLIVRPRTALRPAAQSLLE